MSGAADDIALYESDFSSEPSRMSSGGDTSWAASKDDETMGHEPRLTLRTSPTVLLRPVRSGVVNALAGPAYIALGVLAVAGVAKLTSPSPTASALDAISKAFTTKRLPRPLLIARVLGAVEVALAIAAAILGWAVLYVLVAAAYASFTVFIFWALNGNAGAISCGCFGHEDTPPTPGHAAFNAAATAITASVALDPVRIGDFEGSIFEAVLSVALVGLGVTLVIAALTALPRTLSTIDGGSSTGSATRNVQTFNIGERAGGNDVWRRRS